MEEESKKKEILVYKVLIIGNSSVGKTSILLRFCDGIYEPESISTVGIDMKKKFIKRNDKKIQLNIIDTAGQEKFKAIATSYFKNVDGIIIVYDISQLKSFQDVKLWINSIVNSIDANKVGLVIAGNKIDLEGKREVKEEMRKNLEEKEKIKIIETSAKNSTNINEIFLELVDRMEQLGLGNKYHSSLDNESDGDPNRVGVKLKDKPKRNERNNICCGRK